MISGFSLIFSGVLDNPLLAVVGELGSDVARLSWFPLLWFFLFPLAILLFVFIHDLVSVWSLSLLWILLLRMESVPAALLSSQGPVCGQPTLPDVAVPGLALGWKCLSLLNHHQLLSYS